MFKDDCEAAYKSSLCSESGLSKENAGSSQTRPLTYGGAQLQSEVFVLFEYLFNFSQLTFNCDQDAESVVLNLDQKCLNSF